MSDSWLILEEFSELLKNFGDWEDIEGADLVSDGDWVQDHKYQYREQVVRYKDTLIQINESRSGSYHSDWYYNDTYLYLVEEKIEVIERKSYVSIDKRSIEIPGRY